MKLFNSISVFGLLSVAIAMPQPDQGEADIASTESVDRFLGLSIPRGLVNADVGVAGVGKVRADVLGQGGIANVKADVLGIGANVNVGGNGYPYPPYYPPYYFPYYPPGYPPSYPPYNNNIAYSSPAPTDSTKEDDTSDRSLISLKLPSLIKLSV